MSEEELMTVGFVYADCI